MGFNQRQLEAIDHVHGPMLVMAGAGTGKTTVLVERIVRLIERGHAQPGQILAITFTDNAAEELRRKAQGRLREQGLDGGPLAARTFHAYGYDLLHRCGKAFRVLSKEDLWIYLRRRLPELELRHFIKAASPAEFLTHILDFFDRCHDELVRAERYEQYVAELARGLHCLPRVSRSKEAGGLQRQALLERCAEIARVYRRVERMLAEDNLGTFGMQIVNAVELLRQDAALLAAERQRARFVLIDEFQDSNVAQIELAQLVAGPEQNLFAVGDPDQAIYRFRGASSAAFEEFLRRFPGARGVTLEENYRSTASILRCAFAVIQANPQVNAPAGAGPHSIPQPGTGTPGPVFRRRPLVSARELGARGAARGERPHPAPMEVVLGSGKRDEAADIALSIHELQKKTPATAKAQPPSSIPRYAVLYRSHAHRHEVAAELAARGIPHQVEGIDALDTPEVRELMAGLRAIARDGDSESLFRIAALPLFRIDPEVLRERLNAAGRESHFPTVLGSVPGGEAVLRAVEEGRAQAQAVEMRAASVLEWVIGRFGFDPESAGVKALRRFAGEWESKPITATRQLAEFLDYMKFLPEANGILPLRGKQETPPEDGDAVRLMTAHAAKGLEFENVWVLRANSSSFPAHYSEPLFEFPQALRASPMVEDDRIVHREEERRLFYVAMTRARDRLIIHARRGQGSDSTPAGFLRPLLNDPSLAGDLRRRGARRWSSMPAPAPAAVERAPVSGAAAWLSRPPRAHLQNIPLSAHAVETYETCPLKFKIERDWKVPGRAAAAMTFGNVMHTVLRACFDPARQEGPLPPKEQVFEFFRAALAAARFDDPWQRRLFEEQGLRQLENFIQASQAMPPQVLAVEAHFELVAGGTRVTGRMDRVDQLEGGGVAVVDYKTGAPRSQEDADRSLQLSIYALAAEQQWGRPLRLLFHNLEDGSTVATIRERAQREGAEARIQQVVAGIAAGNFEPTPSYHCRRCEYRGLCPAMEERFYSIEVRTAAEAS